MWVHAFVVLIAMLMVTTAFVAIAAPHTRAATSPPTIALPWTLPDFMRYIIVNNYKFDPLGQMPTIPDSLKYTNIGASQESYYIVQFNGPVYTSMKDSLAATGAVIIAYINYNAFIVRADGNTIQRVQGLPTVRWTGIFEPAYKLSPTLSDSFAQAAQKAMEDQWKSANNVGVVTSFDSSSTAAAKSVSVDATGAPTSAAATNRASVVGAAASPTTPAGLSAGASVGSSLPSNLAAASASGEITVKVLTFEKSWVPAATQAMYMLGGHNILFNFELGGWGTIQGKINRNAIPALAHLPGVMWIEREYTPYIMNDIARWVVQSGNATTFATPVHDHGIHGTNQTVTLGDTGIDYHHPDFWDPGNATPGPTARKLTAYYDACGSTGHCDLTDNGINHGTHTSGSAAGDDGKWHVYDGDATGSNGTTGPHDGQAFDAFLNMQDLSDDGFGIYFSNINDLWNLAVNHSSWVHSDSWGSFGNSYGSDQASTDMFVWANVNFTIFFAAGNAGSGLGSINPYSGAKNVISVGATVNGIGEDNIASFSSRGPMADGRLKPDIMAPGVQLWSAKGQCPSPCGGTTYWQLSGTSMATPTSAGSGTLVRQYYMDGWYPSGSKNAPDGFTPTAALIKATLINGAVEMTGAGAYDNGQAYYPNDNQGWGRVNLGDVLFFAGNTRGLVVDDHRAGISTSTTVNYTLDVGDTSQPVEMTLVWSDYPGVPFSSPNLVNDLDLVVTAPDGTVYRGNVYAGQNPGQSVPNPPVSSADHLNNVESVLVISNVQAGVWTVSVHGFNVPQGPQPYALVMTGGIATNRGQLSIDHHFYKSNAIVHVTVVDTGLNLNPTAPDTGQVNFTSSRGDSEVVTVTETGNNTAVFKGQIQLDNNATATPGNGMLEVLNGDNITADYFDTNNGQGQSVHVIKTAGVDDTPPSITAVAVTNLRFNRATITWSTDEPSTSVVFYGNATPPSNPSSVPGLVTSHSIPLSHLTQNTTYFFSVQSTDEAGNTANATNGTSYFHFTTPLMPPTAAPNEEWPMFHNNLPRLGSSPSKFHPPLNLTWTAGPYNVQFWNGPVLADGTLYTYPLDGTLRARDPYTGTVLWARHLGDTNYYTPTIAVDNGVVFATSYGSAGGHLYALDENTGATIWVDDASSGLDFNARIALAATDGKVFGSAWGGEIFAISETNGSVVWKYQTGESFPWGGPAVAGGLLFEGTTAGDVFALDEVTGALVWKATLDGTVSSVPLYAAGSLYVGTYAGSMYSLDAFGGTTNWKTSTVGQIDFSTPSYDGTNIYFGSFGNDAYYALDAATGGVVWSTNIGIPIGTSVAYAHGFVYGNAWDGQFRVLNATNGVIVEQHALNAFASTSAPAISDGWVYFEDFFGNAYAYFGQLPVGVIAGPASQTKPTIPSSQVDFSIDVKNVGVSGPDTFDVTTTPGVHGWAVAFFKADGVTPLPDPDSDGIPDVGPLASNAMATIIARVTVPGTVNPGDTDTTHITFHSANDLTVEKTVKITTVVPVPGVAIGPRGYFNPQPGQTVNDTLTVTNTGGFPDTIDITAVSDGGWSVSLFKADGVTPLADTNGDGIPDTGTLVGLTSANIVVRIQVPPGVPLDTLDKTKVTGMSTRSPGTNASNTVVIELVRPPNVEWPTFHNNNARHGESPSIMSPPLTQLWTSGTNTEELWTGPVLDSGILISTTLDGFIRARDPFTGDVLWSRSLGGLYYYTSTPTVANGEVFAIFDTGFSSSVYALDEMTGQTRWAVNGSSPDYNARIVLSYADGMVFGSTWGPPYQGNGLIFALDAATGSFVWSTSTGSDTPWGGATIAHGRLYMPAFNLFSGAGTMYALDEKTGAIDWTFALDGTGTSVPLYAQGLIFEGTYGGTMWALDAATGKPVWSNGGVGLIDVSTPSYNGTAIFFGSFGNPGYFALDVGTGQVLWNTPTTGPVGSTTAYANGFVYGTSWDGHLRVLYASNGTVADTHAFNILASTSAPAISRGMVWAEDLFGEIYGFGAPGAGVVRALAVAPTPVNVVVANAVLLKASGIDAYGNPIKLTNVSWSSIAGLGTIIPVSRSGDTIVYVAGTTAGVDTAEASSMGFNGGAVVNVLPGALNHISVTPTPMSVVAGSTQQFAASALDRYGNPISGSTFTWGVVGSIGTISSTGLFTASTSTGAGVITATSGTTTGTAVVSIVPGPISTLAVSPTSLTVAAGSLGTLSAVAEDAHGNAIPGAPISWSVDHGTVVALNAEGTVALFTALTTTGTATITVTSGSVTKTVTVTVVAGPVASLTVSPSNPNVAAGSTQTFTAAASDVYGNAVTGLTISWSSSSGSVDTSGVFTAPTATGTAVVTATAANHQAWTSVNVIAGPLTQLVLSPTSLSLAAAGGASLSVVGQDAYGNTVPGLTYTWSTTLGTVQASGDGRTAAFFAGTDSGTGTITVATQGKTATLTVTVAAAPPVQPTVGEQLTSAPSLLFLVLTFVFAGLALVLFGQYRAVKKKLDERRVDEVKGGNQGGTP